eukprot:CAMPEP_0118920968 /NCGR_PEP_ID=MMETSP1169-20130426/377_1 /TAXON_ID=36882 /ORGANISM="Pyramimonas obovata, Strain CCMP722" /LENGTH=211 /DNA_ID=CAMNT_0006861603 /DNA_START=27 /DNA_END=662 /DNA_ORIENTATION=+
MFDFSQLLRPNKYDVVRKGAWHRCKYNWEVHACRFHDTPWGERELEWEDGVKLYFYKDKKETDPKVEVDQAGKKWDRVEQPNGNIVYTQHTKSETAHKNKITWEKNKIVKFDKPKIKTFNYVCGRYGRVQAKYDDRVDIADGTLKVEDVVYDAKFYKGETPKDNTVATLEPDPEFPRWELANGGNLLKENSPINGRQYEADCRWGLPIFGW